MMHVGDIISSSGDVQYIGGFMMHVVGYHEYIEGCSVHRGFPYKLKGFYQLAPPHTS